MAERQGKVTNARFDALMEDARTARCLALEAESDPPPAHTDRAAENAFRRMEAAVAAGAALTLAASGRRGAAAARFGTLLTALKRAAAALLASALLLAGSYALFPDLREAAGALLGLTDTRVIETPGRAERSPTQYEIPSPGEGYELREDVSTDTMAARWFVAERRLLMVQIARELPDVPTGEGELVTVGGLTVAAYDVDGDQELLLYDGEISILIKMFNASRDELLAYAEVFAEANELDGIKN